MSFAKQKILDFMDIADAKNTSLPSKLRDLADFLEYDLDIIIEELDDLNNYIQALEEEGE